MALTIDLKGKVVLITGVSSGIGKAAAEKFAQAGANIVGCAIGEQLPDFESMGESNGVKAVYIQCDVTKPSDIERLVDSAIEHFGKIDVLVSSAGRNVFKGAEFCSEEDWMLNQQLNLTSHWQLAKLCQPHLAKSEDGVIIIMTSNHGFETIPGCFPYNVTKTALTGLVRALAIEWGPQIRTVGIAPGFIQTPGNDKWFGSFTDPTAEYERTVNLHPVKRLGTPAEVGAWCVFLASEFSCFASGTTYLIDGGRSALMQDS